MTQRFSGNLQSDVPASEYPFGTTGTVASGGCCHCRFNDTAYMNVACGRLTSFMTMLQNLMMARCDISDPCRRLGTDVVPHEEWYEKNPTSRQSSIMIIHRLMSIEKKKILRFDFIVVGAGVAGPVIAKRLSDYRWWRVLLVEAGPEEPSLTALPGLAFNAINSSLDWRYLTEPTEPHPTACLGNYTFRSSVHFHALLPL